MDLFLLALNFAEDIVRPAFVTIYVGGYLYLCNKYQKHRAKQNQIPPWVAAKQPGTAYVYMNYGMYWLLNVLVKGGREDGFVLIRALEPVEGVRHPPLGHDVPDGPTGGILVRAANFHSPT